ncbi:MULTISPECIES: MmcQ/YjbR family DNA-binding protein [Robiginitalea]|jgi:predicted DNA-binding protein (MmcQ/YjbR family)|uniref:Putative MmcQ-like protein n=1 Tax=Robiginitalea biformata (strain ATCC BAA-864 / DSM 15991 / KCTC 12146 / HTCC2501) TaxID=313596 RepID=A4CGI0_ROBBH|nr:MULTISPECIES: MmcQ/YjbR family DNA-binding protein [Robiginitalea]EAR16038.1 putative MmcQ-like protein [Robiginitalea biformata HTCC2501]MDC6354354.1 MmcQ/YjbR family DNA-binding protein [Robiginitalea sp. PM2]MDC6374964.1 MmcQ/YjbR family DNA-binding protein [Robiginitalea sp. SP8]
MHIEEFREYCLAKKGVTEGFPFGQDVLVFKVMGKMFALTGLDRHPPQANLKADPERIPGLREEYDGRILPGYHMNKDHWNTVMLQGLPADLLRELIDHSYELIVASLPAKSRKEWEALP